MSNQGTAFSSQGSAQRWTVKAKTTAFGNYIDPSKTLADLPSMVLVEVDSPEYQRNGLGRMIAKTLRYEFVDIGAFGCEGLSIGADGSRAHMIYAEMNPLVLGTASEVADRNPALAKELMKQNLGPEMVALGVLRGVDTDPDNPASVAKLLAYLNKYHRRATWMESHAMEVRMANIEALVDGVDKPFEWRRIFPNVEAGEI
jgi:hypothetical protein